MILRPYQTKAVSELRRRFSLGRRRVILQATCGAGKTVMASDIVRSAIEKGSSILFFAHRRELIFQCSSKLDDFEIRHGVIMAGVQEDFSHNVQVASVQTYIRRITKSDVWKRPADILILDECHNSLSETQLAIIKQYPDSIIIGLTATPCRGDGRGLGEVFDDMVEAIAICELQEKGFLVPVDYYAPELPDLEKLKITAGDYNKKALGVKMDKPKLIGNIYKNWIRLAGDRKTIIFASNVSHSKHIRALFQEHGIACEHIDAKTPTEKREERLDALRNGDIQVITNCMILTEGFDFPEASCIVLARPTKSLGLYLQMAGRGLRIADGKDNCIIIDHAGCIYDHGLVEDEVEWTLDGKKKAAKKQEAKPVEKKLIDCPLCDCIFSGQIKCPQCGTELPNKGKDVKYYEAQLAPVKTKKATMDQKRKFYSQLEHLRREKGYQEGWTAHKFRERFSTWPKGMKELQPRKPDQEFIGYMRHLNIKNAKRRENEKQR